MTKNWNAMKCHRLTSIPSLCRVFSANRRFAFLIGPTLNKSFFATLGAV